jgi:hypothetical protein
VYGGAFIFGMVGWGVSSYPGMNTKANTTADDIHEPCRRLMTRLRRPKLMFVFLAIENFNSLKPLFSRAWWTRRTGRYRPTVSSRRKRGRHRAHYGSAIHNGYHIHSRYEPKGTKTVNIENKRQEKEKKEKKEKT